MGGAAAQLRGRMQTVSARGLATGWAVQVRKPVKQRESNPSEPALQGMPGPLADGFGLANLAGSPGICVGIVR